MNERELLELAAKAAGLIGYQYCESWDGMAKYLNVIDGFDRDSIWRPHKDDGDALRLMAACDIYVMVVTEQGHASARIRNGPRSYWNEPIGNDQMAAIRRAIVRAAAATVEEKP